MDEITEVKNNYRMTQWLTLIQDQKNSGLSIHEWCSRYEVSESQYYYWLRKIRKATCTAVVNTTEPSPTVFQKLEVEPQPNGVHYVSSARQENLFMHLPGLSIEVPPDASRELLEAVLHAWKAIC